MFPKVDMQAKLQRPRTKAVLLCDSLTVMCKWHGQRNPRIGTSYCCFSVEVPEHWDLDGGSNGRDTGSLESRRDFFPLSPFPSHLENKQTFLFLIYLLLAFSHTLCLVFEDSTGLESCLKQGLCPTPFPYGIACACGLFI